MDPGQGTGGGMDPVELKREFGKDLVFWGGGCDTQQVHNILAFVPPENVIAMLNAVNGQ